MPRTVYSRITLLATVVAGSFLAATTITCEVPDITIVTRPPDVIVDGGCCGGYYDDCCDDYDDDDWWWW